MGDYHLWHPCWLTENPATLDCFVTLGEAFWLAHGDDNVVAAVLGVLGIHEAPRHWTLTAGRTHYFTSYYEDATEWRDRWSLAWRLRCELSRRTPLPAMPTRGFLDVDFVDSTHTADRENDASWPCWVIAEFRADAAVRSLPPPQGTTWTSAYGRYPQLRIDLGDRTREWYESGAKEAEELLTKLRAAGASTRFHETRDWYAQDRARARQAAGPS